LELCLKRWREENPLSPSLEGATERFFEAMESASLKKQGRD